APRAATARTAGTIRFSGLDNEASGTDGLVVEAAEADGSGRPCSGRAGRCGGQSANRLEEHATYEGLVGLHRVELGHLVQQLRGQLGALFLEVLPHLSQGSCIGPEPSRLLGVWRLIDLQDAGVDGVDESLERDSTRCVILLFPLQSRGVLDDECQEISEPRVEACRAALRMSGRSKAGE